MMRYQRVSPDCLALPNGRKQGSIRSCKDDEPDAGGRISSYAHFESAKPLRVRSGPGSTNPTTAAQTHDHFPHFPSTSDSLPPESETNGRCSVTGEVVLQWGHNKRSRGSRAENRTVGDESSVHSRQMVKIQRRAAIAGAEKIAAAAAAAAMPPPCGGGYTRGANLRPCMSSRDSTGANHSSRNAEERSGGQQSRSDKRSPQSPPPNKQQQQQQQTHHHHHNSNSNHKAAAAAVNGFGPDPSSSMNPEAKQPSDQDPSDKMNLEQFEWPRIYISLSRKEKEDDFMAMKGTKLPQRPKKRAKNVDKTLQYCFPGMWLSDLTRGRYEVREKKCVKKKCRGLKGMESMDSDSE